MKGSKSANSESPALSAWHKFKSIMANKHSDINTVFEICISQQRLGTKQVILGVTTSEQHGARSDKSIRRLVTYLKEHIPPLDEETVRDFITANRETIHLGDVYTLDDVFIVLTEEEMQALFEPDVYRGWDTFRVRYPASQGLLMVSQIGFNTARTQALICVGQQLDGLMGYGEYVAFGRSDGEWQRIGRAMAWMA